MRGAFEKGRSPAPIDDEVNLGTIGRALWNNKRSIVGPVLIVAAMAFIAVNSMTPRYESEARVLIESRENVFLRPEAEKALVDRSGVDQETVSSQVQLLLSRDLALAVIKQLNLTKLPEFNAGLKGFSPSSLLRYIGLAKDPLSMTAEERVLAAYYDRLNAYAVEKSRVIAIEFQSADPELAARAANAVAEQYLAFQQVAKQDQARSAGRWLSHELDKLRGKVSEAEAKVEAFRAKSNLFVGTNNTSLTNQQLTELSSQVSAARAQKAEAEVRARLIRDALHTGKLPESSDIANSDLVRRLSEQRVTLRAQLAEQSSTLLPQHPRIKELKAQIADLDQQIRSEGERLARTVENDAKMAGTRLQTLSANLDQLKRHAAASTDQDVQLRALEREAKAQRELFESYLAKYREATARDSIAAAPADARVISRAVVSNVPHFPKKLPIVLIAAFVTFCLSTAFVTTSALLGGAGQHPEEPPEQPPVEARPAPVRVNSEPVPLAVGAEPILPPIETGPVPALVYASPVPAVVGSSPVMPAAVPADLPGKASPVVDATPEATAPETVLAQPAPAPAIDQVAAALRQAGDDGRRIIVIGSARNVGTTLSAIALARTLAQSARVVLVDLAFESPNIEVVSAQPAAPGIIDLVRGAASFGDIITRDRASHLHLVAAGQVGADAGDLIGSPMLASAVGALAQSYDYLVIDAGAPPEMALTPIVAMAPQAVLVGGDTADDVLKTLAGHLRSVGFVAVTVLTGPPPRLDHGAVRSTAA